MHCKSGSVSAGPIGGEIVVDGTSDMVGLVVDVRRGRRAYGGGV